jgi:hypothetical protein
MLSLAPFFGDKAESPDERAELYQPIAEAISAASKSPADAALLISLSWHETKWSRAILEGRCDEMPAGQRCDGGHARGVFSLHRQACPAAWELPYGSTESLHVEAACALRLLRWNAQRGREHALTPLHAAFAGYGARSWHWSQADDRVKTVRVVLGRLAS